MVEADPTLFGPVVIVDSLPFYAGNIPGVHNEAEAAPMLAQMKAGMSHMTQAAFTLPLPPMLLQTLVENAVKHGIAQQLEGGTLRITAQSRDGQLRLEVENSGQMTTGRSGTQVGLQNARERLRLLYGEAARLEVRNRDEQSVLAEVVLPAPRAAAEAQ